MVSDKEIEAALAGYNNLGKYASDRARMKAALEAAALARAEANAEGREPCPVCGSIDGGCTEDIPSLRHCPAAQEALELHRVASKIAADAFKHMPKYGWGEPTTTEVYAAIQIAALSALTTEPAAPEGRQENEPRAYIVHAPENDYYGTGSVSLQFHPLAQHDMDKGYRQTPLYEHPAHELSGNNGELTDAMIEAALNEYIYGDHDMPEEAMLAALKAAMAAGRCTIGIKNVDKLLKV